MKLSRMLFFVLVLFLLDQLIKSFFVTQGQMGSLIVYNQGISFSLLSQFPWRSILPFVLFLLIGFFLQKQSYGMALLIAGGLSNLADRLWRGGVVDFIDLKIIPVFNLSDLLISMGCILTLIELIKQEIKE